MPRRRSRSRSARPTLPRFAKSSYARRLRAERLEDRRMLATLTVETPLDSFFPGNLLSLREAVDVAQDGDTITFAPGLAGETITLFGDIQLEKSVTIDGDIVGNDGVPDITISGGNRTRIFDINASFTTNSQVILNGLNLVDGRGRRGGAIDVGEEEVQLTVANSTLSGNTAEGSGGAIYNHGSLSVTNSFFANNSAGDDGGAIYGSNFFNDSSIDIISSTFSGNAAGRDGGAIYDRSELSVTNSTIVGNSARRVGAIRADSLALTHSTVTGNVAENLGGIQAGSGFRDSVRFQNSLVVGNSDTEGLSDISVPSDSVFAGSNIFSTFPGFESSFPSGVVLADATEVFDQTATLDLPNAVPSGLLADNGGRAPSVALLDDAANPAIDVGFAPIELNADVRGFDRGVDSPLVPGILSDAGSFELQTALPPNAPLVVTTASDTEEDGAVTGDLAAETADGLGLSLREAVELANAIPGTDTIVFDFGVDGPVTIFLAQGELRIADKLSITGDGKDLLTIDAQQASRLFNVDRTVAEFSGLTLTGGSAAGDGGAVRSFRSALRIADSVISGSVADRSGGGVSTRYGRLEVVSSTIRDNRSLLDNTAFYTAQNNPTPFEYGPGFGFDIHPAFLGGGGVYSAASTVEIRDSLIAHNEADNAQVNFNRGEGGGIRARFGGSLRVVNSTISGNRAGSQGSGIAVSNRTPSLSGVFGDGDKPDLVIENSTITRNAAPRLAVLVFDATVQITNSIVVENIAVTPPPGQRPDSADIGTRGIGAIYDPLASITSSLVTISNGPGGLPRTDLNGGFTAPGPHLGPLADNGGPTLTHQLLPFSTAIDAGNASLQPADTGDQDNDGDRLEPLPFDQRGPGFERVFGAGLDPGAIESRLDLDSLSLVVTTLDDEFADFSPDDLSLREAIALAGSGLFPGHDEITFADGLTGVITLEMGELQITESVTITGPGRDLLALDGNEQSRVLHVDLDNFADPSIDLTINGLTIQNGRVTIDPEQRTSGLNPTFFSGGGIRFRSSGALTLNDSTVTGNQVVVPQGRYDFDFKGGGIFAEEVVSFDTRPTLQINRSDISQNQLLTPFDSGPNRGAGGGISLRYGSLSISDSTVSGNDATYGGGINLEDSGGEITRSTISENNAAADGGGIFGGVFGEIFTLIESTVSDNHAEGDGGGIRGNPAVVRSTISGNSATRDGGGVYGDARLYQSTVTKNHAGRYGGGLSFSGGLNNSIVAGNTAEGVAPDIDFISYARHSLIGVTDQLSISGTGSLLGTPESPLDPRLGPLADNGGSTLTHALLPGSPAIDAGDPDFDINALRFGFPVPSPHDQRGEPFARVVGERIDIGAYETQGIVTRVPGDYNGDNVVDAADYTTWRDAFDPTTPVTPHSGADGDGDGFVTLNDRNVWRSHFGFVFTPPAEPASAAVVAEAPPLRQPAFVEPEPEPETDAAFAALAVVPPPTGAGGSPSLVTPGGSVDLTDDDALLLLALAPASDQGDDLAAEITTLDDAFAEDERDKTSELELALLP